MNSTVLTGPVIYISNDSFPQADRDEMMYLPPGVSMYGDREDDQMLEIDGIGDFDLLTDLPLLSPEGEAFLFRKMNFLRFEAEQVRAKLVDDPDNTKLGKQLNRLLEDADAVRNHIAECNLRLVISIARRFSNSSCDFDELMSEGNEILLKAITKFDYSRGFRFSTYATHSVQRHFYRFVRRLQRKNNLEFKTGSELLSELPMAEADPEIGQWIREEQRVTELIARMSERLDEREQTVIAGRFGLSESGVVKTLRELAAELNLSKERVRQLQLMAVDKLRDLFDELNPEMASA
ncbi:MAG: sigma-70 family RNA polymerase sigma factor [Fuerstiella sp.]